MPTLKEEMRAELEKAKAIVSKADGEKRDMTAAEDDEAQTHLKAYQALKTQYEKSQTPEGQALQKFLAGEMGFDGGPTTKSAPVGYKERSAAKWAEGAAEAITKAMNRGGPGSKALIGGTVDVPRFVGEVAETVGRPLSVLDLVRKPNSPGHGDGNAFSYLRQTARTNNATAVPDLATKPTSVYSFTDIESKYSTYAHLSEALPLRYISGDFDGLVEILRDQLAAGVLEAVEADIVSGPGTGDRFTGVLNTSGVQTQAATTGDILTTLSNARYKLVTSFQSPTGWVLNPTDAQRLELLRESGTTGAFQFKNGLEDAEKFLGGFPIVQSVLMPAGTALLGDWRQVELLVREGNHVDIDTGGTLFEQNAFKARAEGRFGLKIGRPLAFVKATLPA